VNGPLPIPIGITFEVDLEGLEGPDPLRMHDALFRAAFMAAQYVKTSWIRAAGALGAHNTGEYLRGIEEHGRIQLVSMSSDPTADTWEVVVDITNTSKHASIVEEGHAAFHLPSVIDWSGPRVKHGKTGPYLNIPFRHTAYATPKAREEKGYTRGALRSMMPAEVHHEAKKLSPTTRQGVGPIREAPQMNGAPGRWVALDRYNWGGRLKRGQVPTGFRQDRRGAHELFEERRAERTVGRVRGAPLINPEWKTSKFEGMFRTGPKNHAAYLTIRTITPTSRGWNIPAQVGYFVVSRLASSLSQDEMLQEIIRDELNAAFGERLQ
jgi:hypothetical protein